MFDEKSRDTVPLSLDPFMFKYKSVVFIQYSLFYKRKYILKNLQQLSYTSVWVSAGPTLICVLGESFKSYYQMAGSLHTAPRCPNYSNFTTAQETL
jgi:hypothetical protein